MRTKIFVSRTLESDKSVGIEVGIVSGYSNNEHNSEYQVFELKSPVYNVGLIGVDNGEEFAISFKPNFKGKYAMAVYLDGINVSQTNGISSINQIEELKRNNYYSHKGIFTCESDNEITAYLYRYNQKNLENRLFTFTTAFNSGINEMLISDPSLASRIEIYMWKEEIGELAQQITFNYMSNEESKVGAGKVTNDKYKTSNGLSNPIYLGKAMFIHLHSKNLRHLGETKIFTKNAENFTFTDPMDLVPKT